MLSLGSEETPSWKQALRFPKDQTAGREPTCSCHPCARAKLSRLKPPGAASRALFPKGSIQRGPWWTSSVPPIKDCSLIFPFFHIRQRAKRCQSVGYVLALGSTGKARPGETDRLVGVSAKGKYSLPWCPRAEVPTHRGASNGREEREYWLCSLHSRQFFAQKF